MYTVKIFYSYSRQDKRLRDELDKHLESLKRLNQITTWYDREIQPGADWKQEIEDQLNTADIILLLLSPNFVSSNYCYGQEMQHALARHVAGEVLVIPIILRPVSWKELPIANLQALPTSGKPVSSWRRREEAFEDIVHGIHQVVKNLQLRRTNESVAQEVSEETTQKTKEKEGRQKPNLFTDSFITVISHVLRSPLTVLGTSLELARDQSIELDNLVREELFNNTEYAFDETVGAIEWFTDLMRIGKKCHMKEIPLAQFVRAVISATAQRLVGKNPEENHPLDLDIPEGLTVEADEGYVSYILGSLLSNVWRYTPTGTPVTIFAELLRGDQDQTDTSISMTRVCVKDLGPGIPPNEFSKLFDPFYRLKRDLMGKEHGFGLGLYSSRLLVEAIGGSMWAESTGIPGEGSCFYFTLPIGKKATDESGDVIYL